MRTLNHRLKGPPVGPVGIDWGHPRAEGLVFFAPLTAPYDLRDLVTEQRATRTGLESNVNLDQGPPGYLFGTSNLADFPTPPPQIGTSSPFTIAWTQMYRGGSVYSTVIEINFGSGTPTFVVYQQFAGGAYGFAAGPRGTTAPNWAVSNGGSVPAFTDEVPVRFVLSSTSGNTFTASAWQLWMDGVLQTQGAAQGFSGNTNAVFRVGALDGGSDPFEGSITDMRMWSRVLTVNESEEESTIAGAWELYATPPIWVPVSSGGGTTINAGIGNAVAAGSQATISAGATIAAGVGAAVAAGRQASISAGTTVNAGKGNAVAQGLQANIQSGGYIAAGVGNAVAAGRTAGISAGTTISAGVGAAQAIGWRATITNQQTYSVAYGDLSHGRKKQRRKLRKVAVALEPTPAPAPRPLAPLVIREEEILRKGPAPAPQAPRREPPPVQAEPTIADVLTELRALRAELADDRKLRRSNERARMFLL